MSLRDDLIDAKIRRAHIIDMAAMAEQCEAGCNACARCVARKYAIAAGVALALCCGLYIYRKARHNGA